MTRFLTRREAVATVRRGESVAQLLTYVPGTGGEASKFTYVYVAPTPRSGVNARAVTLEDVGDGQTADVSWFPEVDEWEPEFDDAGNLIGDPDPSQRSFSTVEEAFAALEAEHDVSDDRWRHESMVGDDYLAARQAALGETGPDGRRRR